MPDGYVRTQPDETWWIDQVNAGLEYRKKWAYEGSWERWRQYYRGEWKSGILPVNIFFSMLRSTVPRVYFRNPKVSIVPTIPGFLNMAFAQLVNRLDNKVLNMMGLKAEVKDMIQNAFLFGTGGGKLGYGGEFSVAPSPDEEAPVSRSGERFEYHQNIMGGLPWFISLHPREIVYPAGCRRPRGARWWAHVVKRPLDDAKRDPRLKVPRDTQSDCVEPHARDGAKLVPLVTMYEIHDRKFQKVFVIIPTAPSGNRVAVFEDDILSTRRHNLFDLIFNADTECCWGIPDSQILEPQQLEMNETRTQMMKHRRIAVAKILAKRGTISEQEMAKLVSEDVGAVVNKDTDDPVDIIQAAHIPPELISWVGIIQQDVRDTVGFSRNQLGDFQSRRGDTSATEAAEVAEASDIRVDERRDAVADMLTELVTEMHSVMFNFWDSEQIVELVGPGGGPIWVRVDPKMLKHGRYTVRINPESGAHRTREIREARALNVYKILKDNPFADPIKLTKFLLTELEGVEMDDLMRALPPPQGGGEGGPVSPFQLANIIQGGFKQLGTSGPNPMLAALSGQ